ncbi:MAG: CBS domain-containing protein [Thermomicrobiales bacterium]
MTEQSGNPVVTHIMRKETPFVTPDSTIATVAKILVDLRLSGVPVVEDGNIVGIITEADVIAREADVDVPTPVPFFDAIFLADGGPSYDEEMRKVLAVTARDLMSSPVINVKDTATLTEVATLIIDQRVNPIPVLDVDLNYIGIVSRRELVEVISALENALPSESI